MEIEKEEYKCSKCRLNKNRRDFHESKNHGGRPVAYHCKECRSLRNRWTDNFNRQLIKFKKLCRECEFPKKLINNQICKKCLFNKGLKQCRICRQILILNMSFYNTKNVCKECYGRKSNRNTNKNI